MAITAAQPRENVRDRPYLRTIVPHAEHLSWLVVYGCSVFV